MNKKLEKTFDLPSMEDALQDFNDYIEETVLSKPSKAVEDDNIDTKDLDRSNAAAYEELQEVDTEEQKIIKKALTTAEKIDKALPLVKDLESHDSDMDGYATEAMKSYKELMDLGMNSESRHAGKMFEVAQTMMKNAIEAKNAKADKKLRMIELQLKKQRVDQWEQKSGGSTDDFIEGEGYIVGDRNKLLDQLIQKVNENDKDDK
jgi:hypothetical protein